MQSLQSITNNNVNVPKSLDNNVNDNVYVRNGKDTIADKLVEALNNPGARLFYCKVAWQLSEAQIWSNLDIALRGNNPQKYFSWLCKQQLNSKA